MPVLASNFLAGGIISLLFPVTLLIVIWVWYWYSAKRIGRDETRPSRPVSAQTDSPAGAGGTEGTPPAGS